MADGSGDELIAGCIVSQTTGTGSKVRSVPEREIITILPFYSHATSQSSCRRTRADHSRADFGAPELTF